MGAMQGPGHSLLARRAASSSLKHGLVCASFRSATLITPLQAVIGLPPSA